MIRFAVDHPVATWMLFSALMVTGLYALPKLNIEAMPETELPELSIITTWSGASPSAIQRSVTLPIEEAVAGCHGVEDLDSQSRHGRSTVTVKYKRGTNMEFARLDLSERLGAVRRNLPAQVRQPEITAYVPEEFRTEDFFSLNLLSPLSTNELREKADTWLVPRLLAIPGVLAFVVNPPSLGGRGSTSPVQYVIQGEDYASLGQSVQVGLDGSTSCCE